MMICGKMITNIKGFHKDTKIFTKTGWKNIKEVKVGEEIATLNVFKREADFLPCTEVTEHNYKGKMLQCGERTKFRIRYCVTPDTNMLVYNSNEPCPIFLPAKSLLSIAGCCSSVGYVNKFKGEADIKYVMEKKKKETLLEGEDFVFLLGIFYAKAITAKNKVFMPLYEEEELAAVIRNTLTTLNIKFAINPKGIGISIHSMSLQQYVVKILGKNKWERFIGDEIKALDSKLLKIFLKGVFLCCNSTVIASFRTNNDRCVNDLFYVLTKAGYIYIARTLNNVWYVWCSEAKDFTYPKAITEIDYDDKIYSVKVEPYNTIMINFNRASGFWVPSCI